MLQRRGRHDKSCSLRRPFSAYTRLLEERKTYLRANGAICVYELNMGEFRLDFRDLRVVNRPPKQPLQRANGVLEVRDLKSLRGLTDRAMLGTKRDE